ncbi:MULTISPECIES: cystathionine gamma-synthase family protein [Amniculibacterium]|mgnify:CR=1 FL=1|uniref:cystathionine gamma-synthase family protein n=1 Tax=Amniculibacterium TaxID=2715289 RepID=UPI001F155282|nr:MULTISPECIES: cystathionine gamma-synthase family protein [Amniculibacterium]
MNFEEMMRPESQMMSLGYQPHLSEGAIKCPIFQTSTFVFKNAEEGKAFFELAYGLRESNPNEEMGLIYSRLNNPNLEILENRLSVWDKADDCATFISGMAAISTVLLEFLKPGDLLVYSEPLYGGTEHYITSYLPSIGVEVLPFRPGEELTSLHEKIKNTGKADRLAMIYIETPANPTNVLIDIAACRKVADGFGNERKVILAVDNTYMGPIWQHPLQHGADLSIYSATKYIGGHSDLIAGAVCANIELIQRIKVQRTFLGNMLSPFTAWLMLRSLETLKIRMEKAAENAEKVNAFLSNHPKVEKTYYLGNLKNGDAEFETYQKQYSSAGAMISFDVIGGEKEAFILLNNLKMIKLAVSLGGTESLIEHPKTMTHSSLPKDLADHLQITDKLVRLSVGIEHYEDIIADISQALDKI